MYSFKTFLTEAKKYKKELIYANILALLAVLVSTPTPLIMPVLVDEVLLHKPGVVVHTIDKIFGHTSPAYVYVLMMLSLVIVLRAFFFVFNFFQTKLFTIVSKNISFKIRQDLLNHLSKVAINELEYFGSGKSASLMVVDIETIENFLGSFVSRLIISILTMIGVGVVLLMIYWQLALFILILNPVVVVLTTKIAKKVSVLKKKQNLSFEIFQEALSETLELFVQIRAANQDKNFFSRVIHNAKEIKEKSIEFTYKSDGASRLSFLVFLSGFEVFRATSILVVAYSDLSIGLMFGIFGYLWVMMTPIQDILNIQYTYHNAQKALERINTIFALKCEPLYEHHFDPFKGAHTNKIEVRDLSFAYHNSKKILNHINMTIEKGSNVAIVGASGSGKTTLANLLVGLYAFEEGDILYDGRSIKEIGLDVVRDHVYLVLQNPQLFNNTIRENLTFGVEISDEKLYNALEIAQLKDFIEGLDEKLDTHVGRNGIKLSGGQRQRLSIARMIIQDANIVILDESTSALDVHTESKLFDDLSDFLQEKTTIIIAHRLSTIRKADYIYVLDNGVIAEEGTHDKLMSLEGVFYGYTKGG
ncbi:ABC transporter ATP-binding protein [Sulfurospirillum sp. 1612]|uniref:ABC transporter ATP-binding protein n=1 Tax=Sulfurospirillum sp. 1612 TaxID=3094835 RepID=UPI002F93BB82